ncbi:zinc finger X-chromosomal protein-like [Haemaphysalis longicornis]
MQAKIHTPCSSPSACGGHGLQHSPPPGRRLLRCQHCSYVTPFSSTLHRHRCTRTSERPHQCSHCGKAFVQKVDLAAHLRIHMGPSPSTSGQEHIASPTGQLHCGQCSYVTLLPSRLLRHQRTHAGERPHQCSHCDKAFMERRTLVDHLRIHTGERPFRCHLCPADFARKTTLDQHLRSHTAGRSSY